MNDGTKLALAFIGGAAAGAAALALLNRGKIDLAYLKPLATDLISKGMDLKDSVLEKMDAMKEEMDHLAREAREQAYAERRPSEPHPPSTEA